MNLIKSLFISLLILVLIYTNGILLDNILKQGLDKYSIALALISLPLLLFFSIVMILQNTPRTSQFLNPVIASMAAGIIVFIYLWLNDMPDMQNGHYYHYLAIINILLFALYSTWYSSLNSREKNQLNVGNKLPSFVLYHKDKAINSLDAIDEGRVFLFYRGNWCPFCVAQIKELVKYYQSAINSGIEFIMVSPQPDSKSQALAKKFDVSFIFATDRNNQAAIKLGILHQFGLPMGMQVLGYQKDTPFPTVIRVDKEGYITFIDQTDNYRIRPSPDKFAT
ncbi:MAG: redoxin family protein [Enterobacterales bacterium]|nr:redoxin family protein [Enterobacterales bacterium]